MSSQPGDVLLIEQQIQLEGSHCQQGGSGSPGREGISAKDIVKEYCEAETNVEREVVNYEKSALKLRFSINDHQFTTERSQFINRKTMRYSQKHSQRTRKQFHKRI